MNQEINKFIRFIVIGLVILLIVDYGFGKVLHHLYDKMTVGEKARANFFINKDTSDILIFGSSRALYHYHSGLIADSLKMPVYNAGRSNQSILYHLALLKRIVKRHTPKLVILDVNENEFVTSEKKYELLSALLPYYAYDRDIKEIYDLTNPMYKYWSWSKMLPYNSSVFSILYRGLTKGKDKDIYGYLKHDGHCQEPIKTINNCSESYSLDDVLKASFNEFISICKARQIKLYILVSPRYVNYKCPQREFESIKANATTLGQSIQVFSTRITDPKYFSDPDHLNAEGAIIYSNLVVNAIKSSRK